MELKNNTQCPFKNNVNIGSSNCIKCNYYNTSNSNNTVECKHPWESFINEMTQYINNNGFPKNMNELISYTIHMTKWHINL